MQRIPVKLNTLKCGDEFRLKRYVVSDEYTYVVHTIFDKSKNLIHIGSEYTYAQNTLSNTGGVIATEKTRAGKDNWSDVMIITA